MQLSRTRLATCEVVDPNGFVSRTNIYYTQSIREYYQAFGGALRSAYGRINHVSVVFAIIGII